MPYVTVHVDATEVLEEIGTEELVEELGRRGKQALAPSEDAHDLLLKLWQAFYTGSEARAMELARDLAEVGTGRMVPRPPKLRRVA